MRGSLAVLAGALLICAPGRDRAWAAGGGDKYWHEEIYEPFFQEQRSGGETWIVTRRPRARSQRFRKRKPAKTVRVFVLGGSVAMRYDDSPSGAGRRKLADILGRAFPGAGFEVVYCGMGGYDSYREALVLDEVLEHAPDVVVLMSGNSERAGHAGPPKMGFSARRLVKTLDAGSPEPPSPAPRKPGEPGLLRDFEKNLREMVRAAGSKGSAVVLCTLPRLLGVPPRGAQLRMGSPLFARAWVEWDHWRYGEAGRLFRRYIERFPMDALGHLYLARCLERKEDFGGARERYLAMLEAGHSRKLNDVVRMVAGEKGAAVADLETALERTSGRARNERLLMDETHWYRAADPLVSVEIVRALLKHAGFVRKVSGLGATPDRAGLDAERARAKRFPGMDAQHAGTYEERFVSILWDGAAGGPRFDENALARLEILLDQDGRALEDLRQGGDELRGSPPGPGERRFWVQAHIGELYRRKGLFSNAVECLEAARGAPGLEPVVRLQLARAYAAEGQTERARSELSAIGPIGACFPEVRLLARDAGLEGSLPAEDALPENCPPGTGSAGRKKPGSGSAKTFDRLNEAGMDWMRKGDPGRAIGYFDRAILLSPGNVSALINKAVASMAADDPESAVDSLDRVLELRPDRAATLCDALLLRAQALEKLGRRKEALADLERALQTAPADWPGRGDAERARARLRRKAR